MGDTLADESAAGPVRVFCIELGEMRRSSGRSLAGVAHDLRMSRGHLYTILNGEVKRPPDWSRVVEPLLRACGADDATVAAWRGRHQVLEQVYEQLRRHQPSPAAGVSRTRRSRSRASAAENPESDSAAPGSSPPGSSAPGSSAPGSSTPGSSTGGVPATGESGTEEPGVDESRPSLPEPGPLEAGVPRPRDSGGAVPVADRPEPAPRTARRRWIFWTAQAVVVLAAFTAGMVMGRATAPEPAVTVQVSPAGQCRDVRPDVGTNLLALPMVAPSGAPHSRAWWRNDPRVDDPGDDPGGFQVVARHGSADPWDLLVVHSCNPIARDRPYTLSFVASASVPVTVTLRVQDDKPPVYTPSLFEQIAVGPGGKQFTFGFRGAVSNPASELTFQLGGHPDDFRLTVSAITLIAG
jgi:Helix-turn-helix domain